MKEYVHSANTSLGIKQIETDVIEVDNLGRIKIKDTKLAQEVEALKKRRSAFSKSIPKPPRTPEPSPSPSPTPEPPPSDSMCTCVAQCGCTNTLCNCA
jgi:hypothetical protein